MPGPAESAGRSNDVEPLTVLQVIRNLDVGGAQEVVVTLAKELRAEGHRPIVCTLGDGALSTEIESAGIPIVRLDERRHSVVALPLYLHDQWRLRRQLSELVETRHVDVVQTHLLRATDFVVATLRRTGRRPVIYWTIHNYNFELRREHLPRYRWLLRPKRGAHRLLYRWGARRIDGLVAVSDDVRDAVRSTIRPDPGKLVVVPNGVDLDRFAPAGDRVAGRELLGLGRDAFVFVNVATFKAQKGHIHLVDAVARLAPTHPDLRVLLIGDGELMASIEARIHAAGIEDFVVVLGSRRDVPELLWLGDAFVLPSLWEGLPMALLEAMAAGLPCIATSVSGTKQVVCDAETGLLVAPGDVTALERAMSLLMADRRRAKAMGSAGRRRVEEVFGARAQANHLITRFKSDLSDADGSGRRHWNRPKGDRIAH